MSSLLDRVESPTLSTNRVEASSQILSLIETVVTNPAVDPEKIRVLWEMHKEAEDRDAKDAFDEDMQAAQKEIEALAWDKINMERGSRNVSYPKIEKMLRPIREKYGFTESFTTEPGPTADIMLMRCDVTHKRHRQGVIERGYTRAYYLPMPIDAAGPKGGGVMTKPQAVSSGVSYGMRNLAKMVWNLTLLVDKDDTDGNAPVEYITESQAADLQALIEETKTDKKQFLAYMSTTAKVEIHSLNKLPASLHKSAVTALNKKRAAAQKGSN